MTKKNKVEVFRKRLLRHKQDAAESLANKADEIILVTNSLTRRAGMIVGALGTGFVLSLASAQIPVFLGIACLVCFFEIRQDDIRDRKDAHNKKIIRKAIKIIKQNKQLLGKESNFSTEDLSVTLNFEETDKNKQIGGFVLTGKLKGKLLSDLSSNELDYLSSEVNSQDSKEIVKLYKLINRKGNAC